MNAEFARTGLEQSRRKLVESENFDNKQIATCLAEHYHYLNSSMQEFNRARTSYLAHPSPSPEFATSQNQLDDANPLIRLQRLDYFLFTMSLDSRNHHEIQIDNDQYAVLPRYHRRKGRLHRDLADPMHYLNHHAVINKSPVAGIEIQVLEDSAESRRGAAIQQLNQDIEFKFFTANANHLYINKEDVEYFSKKGVRTFGKEQEAYIDLKNIQDLSKLYEVMRGLGKGMRIKQAAMDGVSFECVHEDASFRFSSQQPNDVLELVWEKAKKELERCSQLDTDILIFPELTIPEEVLVRIANWLDTNYNSHGLILVFAGSRHLTDNGWHNRYTTLNSRGQIVLTHDKLSRVVTKEHHGRQVEEGIDCGSSISILNSNFGLIALVICKDFLDEWRVLNRVWDELDVDFLFVPSMGDHKTLSAHLRRARKYARCFENSIFVVNQYTGQPTVAPSGFFTNCGPPDEKDKQELDKIFDEAEDSHQGFFYHREKLEFWKSTEASELVFNRLIRRT